MAEKLNDPGRVRLDRIAEAVAGLSLAYDQAHSLDIFEEEMALRRRLVPNISEVEISNIVRCVLNERVRLAELVYESALNGFHPKEASDV